MLDTLHICCPRCTSSRIIRAGSRSGRPAFHCKECRYTYTTGLREPSPTMIPPVPCPDCQALEARIIEKSGKKLRYQCAHCRCRFTETRRPKPVALADDARPDCPSCSASGPVRCGRPKGKQQYRCKSCGRQFLHELPAGTNERLHAQSQSRKLLEEILNHAH